MALGFVVLAHANDMVRSNEVPRYMESMEGETRSQLYHFISTLLDHTYMILLPCYWTLSISLFT